VDAPPPIPELPKITAESKHHPHVTFITAVDNDSLKVPETILGNQHHGALSWFFAQAISGKADGNQNGRLERDELESFLTQKVSNQMNFIQNPKLLPRADNVSVFHLGPVSSKPTPAQQPLTADIAIVVQNGTAPSGLKPARVVNSSQTFDLRFQLTGRRADVFNHTGDKITTLPSGAAYRWQPVIDKTRLLKTLETQFDMRLKPIQITLREGGFLHFSLSPGNQAEGLNALTVLSLAPTGYLQFLYPLSDYNDPVVVRRFPLLLPPMEISPPLGGEHFVVMLCRSVATGLHELLARVQPQLPEPKQFLSHLHNNRCQVGQYGVFSE